MEVKFVIDVKHGKPRDKGDIENMFNAGRGRIYASAAGEADILNLKGLDVKVYGAIQNVGTQNKQDTQSDKNLGNKAESASPSSVPSTTPVTDGVIDGISQGYNDIKGEFGSIVAMIIDS
jgi:hypothetical protein